MLQYDNSAFYFFALSFITIYLVPSWIYIFKSFKKVLSADDATIGAVSRTSAEKKKAENLKKESKVSNLFKNRTFLYNFIATIVLTAVFFWLLGNVAEDGEVNSFDPFNILEIDRGSDDKIIKKAYRSLSLKYHPDKNPGDREAEAKFMMVSKAYETLTNAESKENWEKYGNPDGKQSLEVSIGLPDWLLKTEYRNLVLVLYLIILS